MGDATYLCVNTTLQHENKLHRVDYFFAHVDEFVGAGGVGIAFGTGAGGQTFPGIDGDNFKTKATAYFASPAPLP